jgi:hypothetical protein
MEDLNMKSAMMILAAAVLAAVVGCENKPSTPGGEKAKDIDVKAGPVDVNVNKDEVKVTTPNSDVEVKK